MAIRARPEAMIWAGDTVGFAIEPLHRGFIFSAPMQIYVLEGGAPRRLTYDRSEFDFGALQAPQNLPDLGFSGFRVLQPREGGGFADAAIFQGASFFRALARGQTLGATARGLTIRTGDPRGEEFPAFRAVWIEKPTPASNTLVIYALLDSESVTGAYRFTLRPGEATIIDTETTLVPRVAIEHFGLGAMSAVGVATLSRNLLFGVSSWDAQTLVGVAAVVGLAAILASFVPARRAASVNPVDALRSE